MIGSSISGILLIVVVATAYKIVDTSVLAPPADGGRGALSVSPLPSPTIGPTPVLDALLSPLPTPISEAAFDARLAALSLTEHTFPSIGDKMPEILLHRSVTAKEFPELGLGVANMDPEPPMEMILLKGQFDISSFGMSSKAGFNTAEYILLVYDMNARAANVVILSGDGKDLEPILMQVNGRNDHQ